MKFINIKNLLINFDKILYIEEDVRDLSYREPYLLQLYFSKTHFIEFSFANVNSMRREKTSILRKIKGVTK